jgi:hypothetical protein
MHAPWLGSLSRQKTGVQLDLTDVPVSEDAHEQTLRDLLPRGAQEDRDDPELGGGRRPDLIEGNDQGLVDSHRDRIRL